MTTATRRLRRASVAGLATIATVGLTVAGAGTAFAFGGGTVTATVTPTTVFAGSTAQAGGNIALALPNLAWNIGDTLSFAIADTGNCNTAANTVGFSATPSAAVSLASNAASGDTKPVVTVSESSSAGACTTAGVKDVLTLTFTNAGNNSADGNGAPTITLAGLKYNIGSNPVTVPVKTVTLNATATSTGGAAPAFAPGAAITDANISFFKVVTTAVGASNGAAGVSLQPISVTDVTGGVITGKIEFNISGTGDTFTAAGTLTTPSGVTATAAAETLPSSTLTYTLTGTVPANGTFTLTGAAANLANAPGAHTVVVTTGAASPPVTPVGSANIADTATQTRVGGVDRYGTAAALYDSKFSLATSAVLTSGANFPDALSAETVAKFKSTGVLLTDPNNLVQAVQQELITRPIATVYIVGGPNAVSTGIQNQIAAMHVQNNPASGLINVIRLAGADRYATNNAADVFVGAPAGLKAVIATGTNFADALAVGPVVYNKSYSLVLTDPASLSASAQSTLTNLGITHVIIVGGTSAVSANVETQLKAIGVTVDYRVAGADRTQTAAQIATWATAGLAASSPYPALDAGGLGFSTTTVNIARGDSFADALAAGSVEGANAQVILLTADPNTVGAGIASYLSGKAITTVNALGFSVAMPPATINAVLATEG